MRFTGVLGVGPAVRSLGGCRAFVQVGGQVDVERLEGDGSGPGQGYGELGTERRGRAEQPQGGQRERRKRDRGEKERMRKTRKNLKKNRDSAAKTGKKRKNLLNTARCPQITADHPQNQRK